LSNKVLKVAKAVASYAHGVKYQTLEAKMKCNLSGSTHISGDLLVAKGKIVFNVATLHAADIVSFGLDATNLTDLEHVVNNFDETIITLKKVSDKRNVSSKKLNSLFAEADDLLKFTLNTLVYVLDNGCENFIDLYCNARSINNRHGNRRAIPVVIGYGILSRIVTNSSINGPIEEAVATLVELALSVSTDKEGNYYFEKVPAGTYTHEAKAATYLKETVPNVEILPFSKVTLDVAMNSDMG
jgi:hypothetical protein